MDGIDKLNLPLAPAGTPRAPRIAPLEPPYAADVAAALFGIHPSHSPREPLKLFRTMVRSLRLCDPMFAFARFMLGRNTATAARYDLRTRELVIDRVTARCGCEYEWGVHMAAYGEKAWITPAQAYSLVHGDCTDACWTDEDRATPKFVDGPLDHGRVWDGFADFDRLDSVSPPTMCFSPLPWGSIEGGPPLSSPSQEKRRGQRP